MSQARGVFVFTNLASSIDGRIADSEFPAKPLGTPFDRKMMQVIRKRADAIVVGASTLRANPNCYKVKGSHVKQPVNVVITRSGELDSKAPFWDDPKVIRFVFTTQKGWSKAMESVRERAFVVVAEDSKNGGVDPALVLERLQKSGLKNILIEGGGEIVGLFLSRKLVHEINLTLTPWILGGVANPALVTLKEGLSPWVKLKITQKKIVKDEIYLKYKVQYGSR